MAFVMVPGYIPWPSWSGYPVKMDVPCPICKAETTTNWAGGLAPGSHWGYDCDVCGTQFDIGGIPSTITILKEGRRSKRTYMPFTCSKHGEIRPEPNKAQCPMCALESAQNRKRAECCYHCTHARNVKWTSWCKCQLLVDAKVGETEVYYHEICSNFEFRPEGEMMPISEE